MFSLTPATILVPLLGFLALALGGRRLGERAVAWIGVGSVGLAALATVLVALDWLLSPPAEGYRELVLWTWFEAGDFRPEVRLHLDPLSIVMLLVVTCVGFLIHLYSVEFMRGDEGYSRFFAYMNLFIAAMAVLVLAGDLLLLYLGWEGVGLSSYLLIGFWYNDPANGRAARKAFVVTRIGDAAMAVALFLLFHELGTLQVREVQGGVERLGTGAAAAAAFLLLAGAAGKSAQAPLQTWLPDAMAGPTPVSALIHAATMVTAGVYLIARMHAVFLAAPSAMAATAAIGAVTLLLAASSALVQTDIKRVLAYSTISQLGYMFLALGVGAWPVAVFHLMTHAFFKALLFLAAGAVILSFHHEHDIRRMGGLRHELPLVFWTFLAGAAALASFPLVTAGFYSKDAILWEVWSSGVASPWLWAAGVVGAFLTALYSFRLVFLVFFGRPQGEVEKRPGVAILLPLAVLAVLSIAGGFADVPETLGGISLVTGFLEGALPAAGGAAREHEHAAATEIALQTTAGVVSLLGVFIAWLLYARKRELAATLGRPRAARAVKELWARGWGFDWFYDRAIVAPFNWLVRAGHRDVADAFYRFVARLVRGFHLGASQLQGGILRWYLAALALGAAALLTAVVTS